MGLARVARYMKGKEDKIAVVVGTVTDDIRLDGVKLPAMKLAVLRITEGARARLLQAGGEVLTFDQLALLRPRGENTVLLRGRKNARTATRYFGAPGVPNSTTRPRISSKGRKVRAATSHVALVHARAWHGDGPACCEIISSHCAGFVWWCCQYIITNHRMRSRVFSLLRLCSSRRPAVAASLAASKSEHTLLLLLLVPCFATFYELLVELGHFRQSITHTAKYLTTTASRCVTWRHCCHRAV